MTSRPPPTLRRLGGTARAETCGTEPEGAIPVGCPVPHRVARGPAPAQPTRDPGTRRGDPAVPGGEGGGDRGTPRPQPRRRRTDHRTAPGVRLTPRPDHLRHRPSGLRPQDPDRPQGRLRHAAQAGRPVGISLSRRKRARLDRVLARLGGPVLRRRPRQGLRAVGPAGPDRGRRGRRRRAHRRNVLGGAEQHRSRTGPPARDRRQRQRPLLRAHDRGTRRAPRGAAAATRLRAGPRQRPPLREAAARGSGRPRTPCCTG